MSKFLFIAVIVVVPLACFHFCTGPFHMRVEECLPHITIALMAVAVHKMAEVESLCYQRMILRCHRRLRVISDRERQRAGRAFAQLTNWFRRS